MSVFLLIISIIGKILLGIILLLVLLLSLILFVPVKYSAKAAFIKDSALTVNAKVSWLFHIIHVSFNYGTDNPLKIRVFGFWINKPKKKTDPIEHPQQTESDKPIDVKESKEANLAKEVKDNNTDIANKELKEDINLTESVEPSLPAETECKEEKNESTKENSDSAKISFYDKIKRYFEIIKSDLFAETFTLCKNQFIRLLKIILPRKWNITLTAGFEDPATTGYIIGIGGILSSIFDNHINIYGNFEEVMIDANAYFKGHITLCKILIILIYIYFNKKIRRVISLFKEV